MSRYSDIDFINRRLPPIYGYWSQPLVPLEQALESVDPAIDQLSRYIKVAKQQCRFPSEHGLTRNESAAVFLYSMEWDDNSFYRILNQALRSEDRNAIKPWFAFLKLFGTALDKLPVVRGSIWRGVNGDISKNFKKGEELVWWSVSSCSSSIDTIKEVVGKDATLFMIEAVNGKKVSGYTSFSNENEVLLEPGTQLRVARDSLHLGDNLHIVHLVELAVESEEEPLSAMAMKEEAPKALDSAASGEHQRHFVMRKRIRRNLN